MMSLVTLIALIPAYARAVDPFEIQVYEADINRPGQAAVELHTNFTFSGKETPEYPGQTPPNHALRMTLEPALGITDWFELGAYIQGMYTPSRDAQFGGGKLRGKFVVPERAGLAVFLGVNLEVSCVPHHVDSDRWGTEFRPFVGWTNGYLLLDVNPIIGFALVGPEKFKPDFEPAFKASWNTQKGFALGSEYYMGLGRFDQGFSARRDQEHLILGTFDLVDPVKSGEPDTKKSGSDNDWELNLAFGRGLTSGTPQKWIAKMIVGKAF